MEEKLQCIRNYTLLQQIGQGGYGDVFKCKNDKGEIFAIKQITKYSKSIQKYIEREIETMKKINCANVIKLQEAFFENEIPYIVMEFCENGNLQEYVYSQPNHVLPEDEAMKFFAQILNGFKHIHEKGFIHRDLKLPNILLHKGIVKIGDFGMARHFDEETQMTSSMFGGTFTHQAPEIFHRLPYGYKVDIWSLGVLLYIMLFYQYPFGHKKDIAMQKNIIYQKCQKKFNLKENLLNIKNPQTVSPELEDLFSQIFIINPDERIGFKELIEHKAVKKYIENVDQYIDFYYHKFPGLFNLNSQMDYGEQEDQQQQDEEKQVEEELEKDKVRNARLRQARKMSTLIQANGCHIKGNDLDKGKYVQHNYLYNMLISRYQFLVAIYNETSNNFQENQSMREDMQLVKYFLLKVSMYYIQQFQKLLQEGDNDFELDEWAQYRNSKTFQGIINKVQQDSQRIAPDFELIQQEVLSFNYNNQEIYSGVKEEIKLDNNLETFFKSIPTDLKLPFRGIILTIFKKAYELGKKFAESTQVEDAFYVQYCQLNGASMKKKQALKKKKTQLQDEQYQIGMRLLRYSLQLLICGAINRVFQFPQGKIKLKNFKIKNQQEPILTQLYEWVLEANKDDICSEIEFLINSYFSKVSNSLLTINSSQLQQNSNY